MKIDTKRIRDTTTSILNAGSSSGQVKRGRGHYKRSPETCLKISEALTRRAAQRRDSRPACLCYCGCGQPLQPRASKHTIYIMGHQPKADRSTPEFRAKLREIQRLRRESGWKPSRESRMLAAANTQKTIADRKAAGKIYVYKGNAGKLKGRHQSQDVIEKRIAPMRGRPQTKPLVAKGPQNKRSISGILRSPNLTTHHFHNLTHFVRTHQHLFLPEDIQWYGKSKNQCRASKGLLRLTAKNHTRGTWKGWTLVSFTETFYNRGESILSGESSNKNTPVVMPDVSAQET